MSLGSPSKVSSTNRISDLDELLRSMCPRLNDGVYGFISVPTDLDIRPLEPIATFREDEGLSLIVEESKAEQAGFPVLFRAAWITLTVNSDLHAVGLTAAVARALADKGVSCNVVAAANHDHLFVPVESAGIATAALEELQSIIDASV
jgi:uncharacterized protein